MKLLRYLLPTLLVAAFAASVAGQELKIPYQAVVRATDGVALAGAEITLRASFIVGSPDQTPSYVEDHNVATGADGSVAVVLGEGDAVQGTFAQIPWNQGAAHLRIEFKQAGDAEFRLLGTSQFLSVPYAMRASDGVDRVDGEQGQIMAHDGSQWAAYDKVWLQEGGVVFDGDAERDPAAAIFSVRNQQGDEIFRISGESTLVSLAEQGGEMRVVGSESGATYLLVTRDSTAVQFDQDAVIAGKGGFAVGGLSTMKDTTGAQPYLSITPQYTLVALDATDDGRANKGGFAVGGLSSMSKDAPVDIFTVSPDSARMYIAQDDGRANKGGFAVGGLSNMSKENAPEYLRVEATCSAIQFEEGDGRANKGGFAVGGLSSMSKDASEPVDYLVVNEEGSAIALRGNEGRALGGLVIGTVGQDGDMAPLFDVNPESVTIDNSLAAEAVEVEGEVNIAGVIVYPPTVETVAPQEIGLGTILAQGLVTFDGGVQLSGFGFVWDTTATNLTLEHNLGMWFNDEYTQPQFSVEISDLTPEVTYYVRAFAMNTAGFAFGEPMPVYTTAGWEFYPTAHTDSVFNVTNIMAQVAGHGVIVDSLFTYWEQGFVWNTVGNPVAFDQGGQDEQPDGRGMYTEGFQGGTDRSFQTQIHDLAGGQTYYVRAFVRGQTGYHYGNTITFTTLEDPFVEILDMPAISASSVILQSQLVNPNALGVMDGGIVFGLMRNPTLRSSLGQVWTPNVGQAQPGVSFTDTVTGLPSESTIYLRYYLVLENQATVYGPEVSFSTPAAPGIEIALVDAVNFNNFTVTAMARVVEGLEIAWGGFHITAPESSDMEIDANVVYDTFDGSQPLTLRVDSLMDMPLSPNTVYDVEPIMGVGVDTIRGAATRIVTLAFPECWSEAMGGYTTADIIIQFDTVYNSRTRAVECIYTAMDDDATVDPWLAADTSRVDYIDGQNSYLHTLTGLQSEQTYLYRMDVLVDNGDGQLLRSEGWESEFFTQYPAVYIDSIVNVGFNTATAAGSVWPYDPAITHAGFVWHYDSAMLYLGQSEWFTIAEFAQPAADEEPVFVADLAGLDPGFVYGIKAFVVLENDTLYSDREYFGTLSEPMLSMGGMTAGYFAVMLETQVYNYESLGIDSLGFVWGTSMEAPTYNPENPENTLFVPVDPTSNTYSVTIDGLEPGTHYQARSFIAYGDRVFYAIESAFQTEEMLTTQIDSLLPGNTVATKVQILYPYDAQECTITSVGVVCSTDSLPLVDNTIVVEEMAYFEYSHTYLINVPVSENTEYFLRGYIRAEMADGTPRIFYDTQVSNFNSQSASGTVVHPSGMEYTMRIIKGKSWMTQNVEELLDAGTYTYSADSVDVYGRLYEGLSLSNIAFSLCPEGWTLPTLADFEALINAAGATQLEQVQNLADATPGLWGGDLNPTNTTGFGAVPSGHALVDYSGAAAQAIFNFVGTEATYWSTISESDYAYLLVILSADGTIQFQQYQENMQQAAAVRCVKTESSWVTPGAAMN